MRDYPHVESKVPSLSRMKDTAYRMGRDDAGVNQYDCPWPLSELAREYDRGWRERKKEMKGNEYDY